MQKYLYMLDYQWKLNSCVFDVTAIYRIANYCNIKVLS